MSKENLKENEEALDQEGAAEDNAQNINGQEEPTNENLDSENNDEGEEKKSKKRKRGSRGGSGNKKSKEMEEELEALEKEIIAVEEERNEIKDKYLRLFAEFDNYRKRTARERLDILKTASADILRELLPVLDDFDRAKGVAEDNKLPAGIDLIHDKLVSNLAKKGLTAMESTGETFDAELHEAITEIPAPTEDMKGKIIDTIERGYKLNDKIIRHAKVVVGK